MSFNLLAFSSTSSLLLISNINLFVSRRDQTLTDFSPPHSWSVCIYTVAALPSISTGWLCSAWLPTRSQKSRQTLMSGQTEQRLNRQEHTRSAKGTRSNGVEIECQSDRDHSLSDFSTNSGTCAKQK